MQIEWNEPPTEIRCTTMRWRLVAIMIPKWAKKYLALTRIPVAGTRPKYC